MDIIAWDYPDYNQTTGSWSQYQQLFGTKNKLFGIAEDGKLIDPNIFENQPWLYFATWAYMIKDPSQQNGKNTAEWIKQVYNDSRVLTLDDLIPGPKAKVGNSQILFDSDGDGFESVILDGSKSFTNSGTIISYAWTKDNIEIATGENPTVLLGIGRHTITLTITTSLGETNSAIVLIKIKTPSLSLNKPFSVSSTEANLGNLPANAVDGDLNTRWSSTYSDPQWFEIDLGKRYDIDKLIIYWEVASAKEYKIEESNDGITWVTVLKKTNMPSTQRTDTIENMIGGARYIRMYGISRTTVYGYSIYEFEVYGTENPNAQPVGENTTGINWQSLLSCEVFPTILKKDQILNIKHTSNIKITDIQIYNIRGENILNSRIENKLLQICMDNRFVKGMYFIKINFSNSQEIKKFVVE